MHVWIGYDEGGLTISLMGPSPILMCGLIPPTQARIQEIVAHQTAGHPSFAIAGRRRLERASSICSVVAAVLEIISALGGAEVVDRIHNHDPTAINLRLRRGT